MSEAETDVPGVPARNLMLEPRETHMEILDLSTRQVWQSLLPVSLEDCEAMELEAPFTKIGAGRAAMDAHGFRRSPGAGADGPMARREFAGRAFAFCAMPAEDRGQTGPAGPRQLLVDKHHSLLFRAGRSVDFLRLPDRSELVHVIAAEEGAPPLKIPEGWTRETVLLDADYVVQLPCPTTVFFFPNGDSFQGPVTGPASG